MSQSDFKWYWDNRASSWFYVACKSPIPYGPSLFNLTRITRQTHIIWVHLTLCPIWYGLIIPSIPPKILLSLTQILLSLTILRCWWQENYVTFSLILVIFQCQNRLLVTMVLVTSQIGHQHKPPSKSATNIDITLSSICKLKDFSIYWNCYRQHTKHVRCYVS